jgi:hypothetical protein
MLEFAVGPTFFVFGWFVDSSLCLLALLSCVNRDGIICVSG